MSCAPFHRHSLPSGEILAAFGDGQEMIAGELADLAGKHTAP